jgi:hypothetical protein
MIGDESTLRLCDRHRHHAGVDEPGERELRRLWVEDPQEEGRTGVLGIGAAVLLRQVGVIDVPARAEDDGVDRIDAAVDEFDGILVETRDRGSGGELAVREMRQQPP